MFTKIFLMFVLLEGFCCFAGASIARQTCGTSNTKYYCPSDKSCMPRGNRCTDNETCSYGRRNVDNGCHRSTSEGYGIQLGHVHLIGMSRYKRSKVPAFEHQFIQYRGFTYEYAKSYGVEILDVNDPIYKYKNNRNINSKGIVSKGYSYCTWEDATFFTKMWKKQDYKLFTHNCQNFAAALLKFLTSQHCHQQQSRGRDEDRMLQLEKEIHSILTDCDIVCCYTDSLTIFDGL